jgi:hypothetical protein
MAVNEVTNAASARAATITVDLVERCMGIGLLMCSGASSFSATPEPTHCNGYG